MANQDPEEKTAHQKRIEALEAEQREIAALNREKARLEQEKFGWGNKGEQEFEEG